MFRRPYTVLNQVVVDQSALIHNYRYFQKLHPQAAIAPVLKANAYGHGLPEVAGIIDRQLTAPFICVDSLYEAYQLHRRRIRTPILILGYTDPVNYQVWRRLSFSFAVFDQATLLALNKHQPGAKIHLKLDTGMGRLGIQPEEVGAWIKALQTAKNIQVEGIYSHYSQADDPRRAGFTAAQAHLFHRMVGQFEQAGFKFKWQHLSATAGAENYPNSNCNLIRLGLGFYGLATAKKHQARLRPALSLTTRIAAIKTVPAGSQLSYGGTYIPKQPARIAILPLGYAEGLSKDLSNQGLVTLKDGTSCPIIGTVCMNMTLIKLPEDARIKLGDEVTVIGTNPHQANSVSSIASKIGTIPYTVLTGLNSTIRRKVV
jgi:alanine racemase